MISDYSNINLSFSTLTKKPSIYFWPWDKTIENKSLDISLYCNTYEQLGKILRTILNNPSMAYARIAKLLKKRIAPVKNALDELADYFPTFLNGETRPQDIVLERSEPYAGVIKIIARCKVAGQTWGTAVAVTSALQWTHPDSPLLAAYSLHLGKLLRSKTTPIFNCLQIAGKILGKNIQAKIYAEINNENIEKLYAMAMADPETAVVAEKLYNKFKRDLC